MTNKTLELKLTPLERTAVHTPTQEGYKTLMQIYELGGWKWNNGSLPTKFNYWFEKHREKTCVKVGSSFGFADKEFYKGQKWKIISTNKFYKKQGITSEKLEKINKYFEK